MTGIRVIRCIICILAFLLVINGQTTYAPFLCTRFNSGCVTGECQNDGTCNCAVEYTDYNCGLRIDEIKGTGPCNVACLNGGTCYTQNGNDRCFCPAEFTGSYCNILRVQLITCSETDMTVNISPYATGNFSGSIYVVGLPGVVDCMVTAYENRRLSLRTDPSLNPCRAQLIDTVNPNGGTDFVYTVIVQYDPNLVTFADEKHVFTCTSSLQGNTVGFSVSGLILDQVGTGQLTGTEKSGVYNPVGLVVTRSPNRGALPAVIRVGDPLYLEINLSDIINYQNHKVTSCTAYSRLIEPRVTHRLIVNGCPTTSGQRTGIERTTRIVNSILIGFRAFKFSATINVFFSCEVQLCTSVNLVDCTPTNCEDAFGGLGSGLGRRKRRDVASNTSVSVQGPPMFVVSDDQEIAELFSRYKQTTQINEESCFESLTFIAITSVFGILLILALILLVIVCMRSRSDNRNRKPKEPRLTYTNATMSVEK